MSESLQETTTLKWPLGIQEALDKSYFQYFSCFNNLAVIVMLDPHITRSTSSVECWILLVQKLQPNSPNYQFQKDTPFDSDLNEESIFFVRFNIEMLELYDWYVQKVSKFGLEWVAAGIKTDNNVPAQNVSKKRRKEQPHPYFFSSFILFTVVREFCRKQKTNVKCI